ncbi:hypothetical protein GGF32_009655 [Allomyces javanicus]|nr:hypothetical protein GGF32_009655 [Allomyces javanicus]
MLSQHALASYLYQNGLLLEDNSNNDRNEKALRVKLSALTAIAARNALVVMLLAACNDIATTNDDLRVAAGRHAPVGDMHMETVRPLQARGTLADPRVDSKEFVVGDLEFRTDTLATPALTTTTTDLDSYRSVDPMANATAITGHPIIARVVSSTPLIEEGVVTQLVSHAAMTTRATTLRGKCTPKILSVLIGSLTRELVLLNSMIRAQTDLSVSARIEYFDRLASMHAVTATETRPLIGNPLPTIHDLIHRQPHILTAKTLTCRTIVACAAYFTMPEPLIGTILTCQKKQLHCYATDDAVKNMSGKRTAAAAILDTLRSSTLPHLTAAPVLNYHHANSTVAGPLPHDKALIMAKDRHFASALENARRPIGIDAVPAAHLQLEENSIQHSSSTAPHLVAASATAAVRTLTHQLPMNAGSAPHDTLLPIRTHTGHVALTGRASLIPRRRSGPTARRTLEPALVEKEQEEDLPAAPAPSTATRRVTERPAEPRVAFTLASDSRGRARSALPAVAAVTEEDEDEANEQAAVPRFSRLRLSSAPAAVLVLVEETDEDEEEQAIQLARTPTTTSVERVPISTGHVVVSRTLFGSPLSRVMAMHGVAECDEEEANEATVDHSTGLMLPLTQDSIVATPLASLPPPTTPKFEFEPLRTFPFFLAPDP